MRFDLESHLSLLQAFDFTGRRLFQKKWQGTEVFSRHVDDPQHTKEQRQNILKRLDDLETEALPFHRVFRLNSSFEEQENANKALYPIRMEIEELERKLSRIPHVSDTWLADHEAYARRCKVEADLKAAFHDEELTLILGGNEVAQWKSWERSRDFRVYFSLSMTIPPREYSGTRRREPAFLKKDEFFEWLERYEPSSEEETANLTPEKRCEIWLNECVKTMKAKERSKDEFRFEAMDKFNGLSRRAFERIWASTVPPSWKASGPTLPR
ncbi:hypothetical protein [Pelagovum sp. HNIBRBA483]|uniref:hypothetical protein n=1 Tax=Pelagovum sp. HNIBRBA483 TaxID=3233341 RepID=UPI0034A35C6C